MAETDEEHGTPTTAARDDPDPVTMARARSRVYDLLAATFDGEMGRLVSALDDAVFVSLAEVLPISIETGDLETAETDERALGIGYDNLFVVPGSHYVPPFASAHAIDPSEEFESDSPYHSAGEAGELLGDPAADIAHLYDAASFEPERGDDIPDHLAAVFEFMAALCEHEAAILEEADPDAEALTSVRELQALTLSHLGWLDQFEAAVAAEDTVEGVFAALARIARTFTAWDARDGVQADGTTPDKSP
ncbi:TorD/DmsD family molecular chaperone [Halorientalis salina]|uniref:TorD/DmsD family molecular chaperone n=1 Tax=Halorientalis salina TaxID=2932266 RepID=UPI002022A794|nr:molecular chaperone TorD family protein [Halorientalis salina]